MPNALFAPEHHAAWALEDMRNDAMNRLAIATVDLESANATPDDERHLFAITVAFLVAEAKAEALNGAWLAVLAEARRLERLPAAERGF